MRLTTTDDGIARTHGEMQQALVYAVPGASVRFWRPPNVPKNGAATAAAMDAGDPSARMAYEITVRRAGRSTLVSFGQYVLPCEVAPIVANAVAQVAREDSLARAQRVLDT